MDASDNSPHLLDLFPACTPLFSPAVAATEIPPPANLWAEIRELSSAFGNQTNGCFLEANYDLPVKFLQWAKENPDQISAEEMRTIEQVTKRLGKKQLLKLSLDPVEQQHLSKRRDSGYPNPNPNPNPAPNCSYSNQTTILSLTGNQMYATPHQVQAMPSAHREATKEARKDRMAKRHLHKRTVGNGGQGSVGNYAASRLGKDGQQQEEPDMKFLLKRVLRKSDVSSLGKIVLPKKEAEDHLPVHESRGDGIVIAVEDLKTSRVWNMRLRFWSKSGMYAFENTGDFVRVNELQAGDFIMLYMNKKCGKYMIWPFKMPAEDMKPPSRRKRKV